MANPDFPEADPSLTVSRRGDQFMVLTSTGEVLTLNALQMEVVRAFDGATPLLEIARRLSAKFKQDVSVEALREFVDDARPLGLLSLRYAGPRDEVTARRRCRSTARRLRSLGLPAPTGDVRLDGLCAELFLCLDARDAVGAIRCAYALQDAAGTQEWVRELVTEIERMAQPSVLGRQNPLLVTIPVLDPTAMLKRLNRWLGWLFTPAGALLLLAFVGWGGAVGLGLELPSASGMLNPTATLTFWVVSIASSLVHELAHALTCYRYGGRVKEIGVGFIFGLPMAYADVTSSYLFPRRRQRLLVTAMGIVGSLWFMAATALVCALLPTDSPVRTGLMFTLGAAAIFDLLGNVVPFIKLDGYYFLAEWLGIDNLRDRSFAYLRALTARLLVGEAAAAPPEATERERRIFVAFAVGALLFAVWFGAEVLAFFYRFLVSHLHGYGLGLFCAGALLLAYSTLAEPLRSFFSFARAQRARLFTARRCATAAVLALMVIGSGAMIDRAETVLAPYELSPLAEHPLNAPGSGQVAALLVQEGDRVEKGQPLVELRDDRLEAERARLFAQLQAHPDDTAAREALTRVEGALGALRLRAPADGFVTGVSTSAGAFVLGGERLLNVREAATVARIHAEWIPEGGELAVRLYPESGGSVAIRSARLTSTGGALVLETEAVPGMSGLSGFTGRAVVEGKPASLWAIYLLHPVKRFVQTELWQNL